MLLLHVDNNNQISATNEVLRAITVNPRFEVVDIIVIVKKILQSLFYNVDFLARNLSGTSSLRMEYEGNEDDFYQCMWHGGPYLGRSEIELRNRVRCHELLPWK